MLQLVPGPRILAPLLVSSILYILYLFFAINIQFVRDNMNLQVHFLILEPFILIFYLLAGIQHYMDEMRCSFRELQTYTYSDKVPDHLCQFAEKRFKSARSFYILLVLNLIIFLIITVPQEDFFYRIEPTIWSAAVDIMTLLITALIIYLFTTILWLIIICIWALDKMEKDFSEGLIKLHIYSSDKMGGLKPIRNFILSLVVYQFGAVALGISNFITPGGIFWKEIAYFLALFLFGAALFFKGWYVINNMLESERARRITAINRMQERQIQRMNEILSSEGLDEDMSKLDKAAKSIEILQKEGERTMNAGRTAFDFKAVIAFISGSLLPILALYEKVNQFGILDKAQEFINQSLR